ncbi:MULTISPECIES: ABC transporter ATP-binding protein [Streptomyces]|uniref:ABC transporter ATP-binding protein n=1 Tax=Streptomyces tsukubensis (strain DSM 42081 / NBRC 108919 / NRRL 18488 / 9993) TaxID=1114943 RepID=A0A7G3URK1_STRT9|nr:MULTISPECIES: ABC transporter ATP-binding protein [Streptomyces]AZK98389.1 teichoic acid ABC transporter ATP-binding protein [Streptomyces tsukubensis]MYS64104.1 ATP-binding cassette domain-containing protein [Streptomyces sp. SID5473]QKM71799.1 ABC transporter ATP-binding protein [Streptomyces tsukubensis NRRL18488]TAI46589.1 ABC transporter ATP-binding protein [Streptomyces tsukubensis]
MTTADRVQTPAGSVPERVPTVVVDGVHIKYRVNGGRGGKGSATAALSRLISRKERKARKSGKPAPGVREVHAVKGVTFTAYKGEAIGLIGSNGSGKSTLLKAIAGLLPTAEGRVYTQGQPSLLGVNAALMSDLTGERNVILGGLAMGMTRDEIQRAYQGIVDFSGINDKGDFISLPMRTYSSGMGARLRFAIAAAKSHDVLLIDEALATGDAKFRRRSQARITELRKEAGTVFLVSHSNTTITETCERALWLEAGVLRMDGPAKEVVAAYEAFTSGKK